MGRYTTVIPLTVILIVAAIKAIYEELISRRQNAVENGRIIEKWLHDHWTEINWWQVEVGEIIRVKKDTQCPADLLLMCTSDMTTDIVYIDTANLDGESNLKLCHVPSVYVRMSQQDTLRRTGTIVCELPNEHLYQFAGTLEAEGEGASKIKLRRENLLLRGAKLKNMEWIFGVAVYTGAETKIWRNLRRANNGTKKPTLSSDITYHLTTLFIMLIVFATMNGVLNCVWSRYIIGSVWYLPFRIGLPFCLETAFSLVIRYGVLLPISLHIYLEAAQIVQANFICQDAKMSNDTRRSKAAVYNSTLNSDLGKVKYIFTDKTGTLTENNMEFKMCSVEGKVCTIEDLSEAIKNVDQTSTLFHFFMAICLCPGTVPIFDKLRQVWQYSSSSSDAAALIKIAQMNGLELRNRIYETEAQVAINGVLQRYEILAEMEFFSDRKRSSLIVRTPKNEIILYVIGADEIIFQLLADTNNDLRVQTSKQIRKFATSGFRTLCFAMRTIDKLEFEKWHSAYAKAKDSMTLQNGGISHLMDEVEINLTLLGATACEDQLQEEVPETISKLNEAGIKFRMLTGDKRETAIAVGYATNMLRETSEYVVLNSKDQTELCVKCRQYASKLNTKKDAALVVSGTSFDILLKSNCSELFVELSVRCGLLICYRMSAMQKAQLIQRVKKRTEKVTLAIGDGTNDAPMIKEANIGVAVTGKQGGFEAKRAADFSISSFRYLSRLLLVHGTWNYNRVSKLVLFIYYKNVCMAAVLLYVAYLAGWSDTNVFDDWIFTIYNVLFTVGPTLTLAILDKQYKEEELVNNPLIYRRNNWFTKIAFYLCLLNSFLHGILITFLTCGAFSSNTFSKESFNDDYIITSTVLYTNLLLVVMLKAQLHLSNWNKWTIACTLLTPLFWVIVLVVYSECWFIIPLNINMAGLLGILFDKPTIWLICIITPYTTLLLDIICVIFYRRLYYPQDIGSKHDEQLKGEDS